MKGKIIFSFSPPKQFEGDPEIKKWYNECAKRVKNYRDKHGLNPKAKMAPSKPVD